MQTWWFFYFQSAGHTIKTDKNMCLYWCLLVIDWNLSVTLSIQRVWLLLLGVFGIPYHKFQEQDRLSLTGLNCGTVTTVGFAPRGRFTPLQFVAFLFAVEDSGFSAMMVPNNFVWPPSTAPVSNGRIYRRVLDAENRPLNAAFALNCLQ